MAVGCRTVVQELQNGVSQSAVTANRGAFPPLMTLGLLVRRWAVCLVLSSVTLATYSALPTVPEALAQAISRPDLLQDPLVAQAEPENPEAGTPTAELTPAIAITNADDAVAQFNLAHQLYIKGEPLTPEQTAQLQQLLQQHPNVYVVLIDDSADVMADDLTLSTGIGNSAAFQSIVNPELGEREGVLLMIYFDSNQGRKIFMRSEELPDRLNVGEANFADSSGTPRELLQLFVDAVRIEGKDVPGALEGLLERINGTIADYIATTITTAQQAIQQADNGLIGFRSTLTTFQSNHGVGGPLGNPEVDRWQQQLSDAQAAFENRQYEDALTAANTVLADIRLQEEAMAAYAQASEIAQQVAATLDAAEADIATLKDNSHTQLARQRLSEAQRAFESYQNQYQAGSLGFEPTLDVARQQAESAILAIEASRQQSNNLRSLILALVTGGALGAGTTVGLANRRASRYRRWAEQELAEARGEIDHKTQELMALMDQADYAALANYAGTTDYMAQQFVARVTDALTLVGGAEKFMAEAEALIQGRDVTKVVRSKNYEQAIALLTDPKTTLTFGLEDSTRKVLAQGSAAESWRQSLLSQDTSRRFAKSLRDVLLAMAENRDAATALFDEIMAKDAKIAQFLGQVESDAIALKSPVQTLADQGQADGVFQVTAVADNLLPMVLADLADGGMVARGRAMMQQDPVKIWADFGEPSRRMTDDATAIVALAQQARDTLVPTLTQAAATLTPHGVTTTWAFDQQAILSQTLDKLANLAIRISIDERLQQTQQDIEYLESWMQTVVRQDQARREICPPLIEAALDDVATARQDIHDALQQVGAFVQGTVDQVLREPEQDPSVRIHDAQTNLDQIHPLLCVGETDAAETCLTNIQTLTQDAHDLVAATRTALAEYDSTLAARQQRIVEIEATIESIYRPTLGRIQATYVPEVLERVAPEVAAGNTIVDNIDLAQNLLAKARTLTQGAQTHYQQAYLLTAAALFGETARVLDGAQHQLQALTQAEQTLAQHQQVAETNLTALTQAFTALEEAAQANYVRQPARDLVAQMAEQMALARDQVPLQPHNPYLSHEYLTQANQYHESAVKTIDADHQAYQGAKAAVDQARAAVSSASTALQRAGQTYFSYATVQTGSAQSLLSSAQDSNAQAQSCMGDRAYEAAQQHAKAAQQSAEKASQAAEKAIVDARRRHEAEERRREEEARRQEEEARRQEEEANSSSSSSSSFGGSSSSSSGGSSGGGSSGSSGGSWGGGGSGSSGGSW